MNVYVYVYTLRIYMYMHIYMIACMLAQRIGMPGQQKIGCKVWSRKKAEIVLTKKVDARCGVAGPIGEHAMRVDDSRQLARILRAHQRRLQHSLCLDVGHERHKSELAQILKSQRPAIFPI